MYRYGYTKKIEDLSKLSFIQMQINFGDYIANKLGKTC